MYDINQLESDWRKYKRKRISFVVILGILALSFIFAAYYYITASKTDTQIIHKPASPKKTAQTIPVENSPALSPEVPSISKEKSTNKDMKIVFSGSEQASKEKETKTRRKHIDIIVSTKKSKVTVEDMESRFNLNKDKDDALFLSRYYYDAKQYSKALKWALETNKLDSNIEESWLLFGKSKAKIGSREEAIRVLQTYSTRTGSKKAKVLLDKIRRGKNF
jgi:tetratricopeptide (TPR) repeat protein